MRYTKLSNEEALLTWRLEPRTSGKPELPPALLDRCHQQVRRHVRGDFVHSIVQLVSGSVRFCILHCWMSGFAIARLNCWISRPIAEFGSELKENAGLLFDQRHYLVSCFLPSFALLVIWAL